MWIKGLTEKIRCNEGFIWSPNNCGCEYDKSYDVTEYSHCENCKCRNRLVDKLVEELSKSSDENEMISVND